MADLKVAMLVPGMPADTESVRGGVHAAVLHLVDGFRDLPVELLIISPESGRHRTENRQLHERAVLLRIPEGPFPFSGLNYLLRGGRLLESVLREQKPQLLHYQIGGTFLMTRPAAFPSSRTLITIHGVPAAQAKTASTWKQSWSLRMSSFATHRLLPGHTIHISNYSKELFHHPGQVHEAVIPNAVGEEFFRIQPKEHFHNRLLYIGIVNDRKNIILLLEVMGRLRRQGIIYTLDICGGFETRQYEEAVRRTIQENELGDAVRFHGWVNRSLLLQCITDSDLLVLPSREETLPMVIAEMMAAGRPVVASATGGIPEMIQDGENGFLFSSENKQELEKILHHLHQDSRLTIKLGRNAKQSAIERYDCRTVAAKTLAFYQQMLEDIGQDSESPDTVGKHWMQDHSISNPT